MVRSVFPGSDAAAKNVMVGDQIVAIDQRHLDPVADLADAENLLHGTPGTTKAITFGVTTGDPMLANTIVNLPVDDLVQNP